MMLIEQTTVPTAALPVGEFRDHLRLGTGFADDGVQDSVLETCLRSAIAAIEGRTGKALISRQFLLSLTAWRGPGWTAIPVAPVTSLISLAILDRSGSPTVVPEETYSLIADTSEPRLAAVGALPMIPTGGAAELVFEAGFGPSWDDLPSDLLHAVFILAADYYENRAGRPRDGADVPGSVEVLISRYRPLRISGGAV